VVIDDEFASAHFGLKTGRYVMIVVSDTGHGMSPEVRERIFEPFFTTKQHGSGTGMGLAVVHGIVAKLGGAISVYSEPGIGSTFNVYIPAEPASNPADNAVPAAAPGGHGHVLVVDDEPDLVAIIERMLTGLGYRVTATSSALHALQLVEQAPQDYDLIVTDQTMPRLPGSELAQRTYAIRPELPVLLCTGFSSLLPPDMQGTTGIVGMLNKPFNKSELARAVQEALGGGAGGGGRPSAILGSRK
jgi:two-component system, cell cycle sensor histidine kinase and response regulator CckA